MFLLGYNIKLKDNVKRYISNRKAKKIMVDDQYDHTNKDIIFSFTFSLVLKTLK